MRSSASSREAVVSGVEGRIADRIASQGIQARGHVAVRSVGVNQRSGRPDLLWRSQAISGGIGAEAALAQRGRAVAAPSAASGRHGESEEDSAGVMAPIADETPVTSRSLVSAYTQLRGTSPAPVARRAQHRADSSAWAAGCVVTGVGVVSSIGTGVERILGRACRRCLGRERARARRRAADPRLPHRGLRRRGAVRAPRRAPHGSLRAACDGRRAARARGRGRRSRPAARARRRQHRLGARRHRARSTRPTARTSSAAPTGSARS